MHGLGNDFVIFDARTAPFSPTPAQVRTIANRRTGIGCDQLVVIEPPRNGPADAFVSIYNANGAQVAACGNASRCVAFLLMTQKGVCEVLLETAAGQLSAMAAPEKKGVIAINMGQVGLDWRSIPLSEPRDTLHLGLESGPLVDPVGVNVGNPHAVFFVEDAEAVDLKTHGPLIETHALFPEFTNVEVVTVLSSERIRMRVWERGVGITQACGTGACAAVVAAHRRGLSGRKVDVILDGGSLRIEWLPDAHVLMTGPTAVTFRGTLSAGLLS